MRAIELLLVCLTLAVRAHDTGSRHRHAFNEYITESGRHTICQKGQQVLKIVHGGKFSDLLEEGSQTFHRFEASGITRYGNAKFLTVFDSSWDLVFARFQWLACSRYSTCKQR